MITFWLVIFFMMCTGFFAGMESAFSVSNKLRIDLGLKQGLKSAQILIIFILNPLYFRLSMIMGYLLSLIAFVVFFAQYMSILLPGLASAWALNAIIEVFLATTIILFLVELPVRSFFRSYSNSVLSFFAIPLYLWYVLTLPVTWTTLLFVKILFNNKYVKIKGEHLGIATFGHWLIESGRNKTKEDSESQEVKIFQNALVFSEVRIRDCMIRRTEIESIDVSATLEDLTQKFISSGYSKIIVYSDSIDNVIGYINSKELFKKPQSIHEKLNPITFVPETMPANKLLHEFMQFHRSIAVVVDEYGGTSGIVTLEDIIEEIFGEIEDEHDTEDTIEKQVRPDEYVFSCSLEIDYLNTKFGINIPESENYNTLAGFILYHHHNLPKLHEIVDINQFNFKVLKTSNTRIELVYLKIKPS